MEYEDKAYRCKCGTIITVRSFLGGSTDYEELKCSECGSKITEIRADLGYQVIKVQKPWEV